MKGVGRLINISELMVQCSIDSVNEDITARDATRHPPDAA